MLRSARTIVLGGSIVWKNVCLAHGIVFRFIGGEMRQTRIIQIISMVTFLAVSLCPLGATGQSDGEPKLPFVDEGACPFEGCQYGAWTATAQVSVRKDSAANSPVEFTILPGEKITAISGKVITRKFGIVKMVKPVVFDDIDTRAPQYSSHKLEIPTGAVLYVLHEEGEGSCLYWYRGATHDQELYAGTLHKRTDDMPWDVISLPKTEWWVKVKTHDGRTGWILDPRDFQGMDALGY